MDRRVRKELLEALQLAHNECAVCPRTCVRHIEVIAILLGWKFRIWLVLDPVTEDRLLTSEFTVLAGPVQDVLILRL